MTFIRWGLPIQNLDRKMPQNCWQCKNALDASKTGRTTFLRFAISLPRLVTNNFTNMITLASPVTVLTYYEVIESSIYRVLLYSKGFSGRYKNASIGAFFTVAAIGAASCGCRSDRLLRQFFFTSSLCAASLCIPTSLWLAHYTLVYLITIKWVDRVRFNIFKFKLKHSRGDKGLNLGIPMSTVPTREAILEESGWQINYVI